MSLPAPASPSSLESLVAGSIAHPGAEIRQRILQAASGLHAEGIRAGFVVALLLRNDRAFIEATLAAQWLGAFVVPLNWHSAADEVAYILADCNASVVIAHADLLTTAMRSVVAGRKVIVVMPPADLLRAYKAHSLPDPAGFEEWDNWLSRLQPYAHASRPAPSSLLYSSGTSGRPKGIKRQAPTASQAATAEEVRAMGTGIGAGSRVLVPAPMYHAAPNAYGLRAARKAALLVLPWRFDPEGLLADIERHKITHLYAVPTMLHRLLQLNDSIKRRYDLSSLAFVLHAGAPCPVEVKEAMIEWWGPVINEYYGSSELGMVTFCGSGEWMSRPGTVGRSMKGVRVAILGPNGNALPPGEVGEICAACDATPDFEFLGSSAARSELQRGEFVATGDLGRLDEEGYLFITDRKTDMIISGGANIYSAEVEAAILGLDGVADCAVFGIPDPEYGEAVAAFVQPFPGSSVSVDGIREGVSARLARFKIPRLIELRATLPREDSGKIRKRLLRDPFWAAAGRKI